MTINTNNNTVDETLLAAILDRLIPAVGDLPSAGQMGLTQEIVRLAGQQKRFHSIFMAAMNLFGSTNPSFTSLSGIVQDSAIRSFESDHPDLFDTLLSICYIVYYKDSRVHERIGWSGQTPQPEGNEMEPWDESVLANIRNRMPFWRKVN
jgi:hypothetical protein